MDDRTTPAACEAAALSAPKIAEELAGRTPKKVIVVSGKLVNIVVIVAWTCSKRR